MHDLLLAQDIIKQVLKVAQKNKFQKIAKIVVELGKISKHTQEITPENLKFNIDLLAQGTLAEKAEIIIRQIKGQLCRLKEIEGE